MIKCKKYQALYPGDVVSIFDEKLINEATLELMARDLGEDVCAQLLALFVAELETLNEKLRQAILTGDCEAIVEVAHILKNSGEMYGASQLAQKFRLLHDDKTLSETEMVSDAAAAAELGVRTLRAFALRAISKNNMRVEK